MPDKPTATDAEIILKLYDLRRESVMRQARAEMIAKFVPKSWDELSAVLKGDHPHFEQAFSADNRKTWETNWICDYTRAS